ncbi:MAG: PAS domain S-box protein [Anaerolineales bacterium]
MNERVIHVLFIEDNPADARLVQEKLVAARQMGWDLPYFEIEHVDHLQTALIRLGEEDFDVVLSDLDLPDSRAGETVATLRGQIPHMPLVVLTGREDETLARKSVRAGVQDYLYKNEATGSLLARTLMYAIERQQIHAELEARVAERTQALQQSNAALSEREQRLHTIFEAAPVGITETDLEGRWLWVNRQFCEMVGYTRDELYTMAYQELTHPDDLTHDDALVQRTLAGQIPGFSLKKRYLRQDGTIIWVKLLVTLVRDAAGEPEYFAGVIQEITEQQRAEEVLRESEERFRAIVDVLPQFIAYTDKDLKYRFVNRTYQEKFGLDADEVLGKTLVEVIGEEAFQKARVHVERALSGEQVRYHERYDYAVGGTRDIDGILVPDVAEDGEVQGYYAVLTDITPYMEMQETLRNKEIRYRRLLDTLQEGVWAIDTENRTTFVNPKMAEMLGHTVEEMEGRCFFDFMDEAGVELARTRLARRRRGVQEEHEFLLLHREGYHLQVLMRTAPILDAAGRYRGAIAGVVNITDRKRAERVTEARLRIAAASATHSSAELMQLALDEIEALTGSRIGFYHFLEADGESVVLQSWSTNTLKRMCRAQGPGLHYPLSKAGVWADCIRERRPIIHNDYASLPHRQGLPPGHAPVVRELVVPVERDRRIVGVFGVGNKPTEYDALDLDIALQLGDFSWEIVTRKRMEEALAKSEQRLRAAQRLGRMGHWDFDLESGKITWSETTYELYERDPRLGPPTFEEDMALHHPEDAARLREAIRRAIEEVQPYAIDLDVPLPNGKIVCLHAIGAPITDVQGRVVRLEGTVQDITERKRAEQEIEHYTARLEHSNRDLEEFAYVISHDLQEPVRTVKGFLELLERRYGEGLDEQARDFIDYAVDGTERMQEMIGALLDLSRVGTQGRGFAPIEVEVVLERALKMLDRSIAESDARVTHDPLPVVEADGVQLGQVFQNLIANAVKFRRADAAPQVHVSATQEGDLWRFSVADDGIGIPPDQGERIFQIFQRLHAREEYPGTGIGLALCRRIVERHGGRIWVESEAGAGATFFFTLPA